MPFDLFQNLVGGTGILELDIEHRIDEVLSLQQPKPVFPTVTGENRTVVEGRLSGHINLCCPPGCDAVFKFRPEGMEVVAATLRAKGRKIFHFKLPGSSR